VVVAAVACGGQAAPTMPPAAQPSTIAAATPFPTEDRTKAGDPAWPTESWPVSTPAEQDMDGTKLRQMMAFLDEHDVAVDSIVVVRHGYIVWEAYDNGYTEQTPHHLQSATKSVSSILIGIALHKGLIDGVEQRMVDFFPGYTIANLDGRKERITLEHLLTMSEGMDWHELDFAYRDERNSLGQMWVSEDAVQHVLDTPMVREPGEAWAYNSGTSILLGGIIEQVTGQDPLSFAREHLFAPIGISDVRWAKTTGDHYHTDGGLYLRPRDMARLGYLMLNGGTWDGQEIVSADWITLSTQTHQDTGSGRGYGYQWWTLAGGTAYAATGHYEQNIYVVPEADLVVVFTADIADEDPHVTDALLYRYILPACQDLPFEPSVETYADFGLSFDYPAGARAVAMPIPGRSTVSNGSGMLLVTDDFYPRWFISAMWDAPSEADSLEEHLQTLLASVAEQPGFTQPKVSTWNRSKKTGHEMLFGDFRLATDADQFSGVIGAWICDQTGRMHIFITVTDAAPETEELLGMFHQLLDGFHCHNGE